MEGSDSTLGALCCQDAANTTTIIELRDTALKKTFRACNQEVGQTRNKEQEADDENCFFFCIAKIASSSSYLLRLLYFCFFFNITHRRGGLWRSAHCSHSHSTKLARSLCPRRGLRTTLSFVSSRFVRSWSTFCSTSWAHLPGVKSSLPGQTREIGSLLPNNQRQHRTLHVQKDVLPYALC